jgi:membrane-bound lytic murein transglycosylase B
MHEPLAPPPNRARRAALIPVLAAWAVGASSAAAAADPPAPSSAGAATQQAAPPSAEELLLQQNFLRWVAAFRADAKAAGIDDATLRAAFDEVRYLPRVIELDRTQPEHSRAIWDYLDSAVSPQRVAQGQDKLLQFRAQAEAAAARHGVAAPIVVAIWGLESRYGEVTGSTPTIDALATLAFEGRRESWARAELLAALRILKRGDIARAQMIGSWAGATGQPQFMPSSFLAYAVDADGDGRRDIWASVADVLASTAHFLARSGWRPGQAWGSEVRLPAAFDLANADAAVRRPTAQWFAEGVRGVDGAPLPEFSDAAILLPAGVRGPAFMVGPNFRAILRYNNSTSYALAVGLLAQRLEGGPGVQAPWPRELVALTRSQVMALQNALNARGLDGGAPDGLFGHGSRAALRRFQRSIGVPADGFPTLELLERLHKP